MEFYYYPFSGPSRCVWMTLEALGVDYEEKHVDLLKDEHKTDKYKQLNPLCRVPVIKNGEVCVTESRAIAMYLCNEFGAKQGKQKLYPTDPGLRAAVDQQLFVDEMLWDAILAYLGEEHSIDKLEGAKKSLKHYDDKLSKHEYVVADHLTIADFFALGAIKLMELTNFDGFSEYPNIARWRGVMDALPYYNKTMKTPHMKLKEFIKMKKEEFASTLKQ